MRHCRCRGNQGAFLWIKGVYWRFCFDDSRISQVQTVCQKQSNGDAPSRFVNKPACVLSFYTYKAASFEGIWAYSLRGAFEVARSDKLGQCESL